MQTNLLVEAFYTDINDVFYLEEAGLDSLGNTILMRRNGSGAVVKGLNLEAKVIPGRKTNIQAGFTLQQSLYKEAQTWSENPNLAARREMFRSPNSYGYMTFSYNPVKPLTLAITGTYTGSMLMQHYGVAITDDEEVKTPDFLDINFKITYDFKINKTTVIQFNAGMQNILNSYQTDFDLGETRDAGYIYGPSLPRSYFAGLKFNI